MNTKNITIVLVTMALLVFASCEKPLIVPETTDSTIVEEEHHNVLVGHKWGRTEDTTYYNGLRVISKCVLSFITDSTGEFYEGYEVVGTLPWNEFTEKTTYTFDEDSNRGIINRIPNGDYVPDTIYFEYRPDNETMFFLNGGRAYEKIE